MGSVGETETVRPSTGASVEGGREGGGGERGGSHANAPPPPTPLPTQNHLDSLPHTMSKLTSLAYLDVSHNAITGCVPDWLRLLIQPVATWGRTAHLKLATAHLSENRCVR